MPGVTTFNHAPVCVKCRHPAKFLYERETYYRLLGQKRKWVKRAIFCPHCSAVYRVDPSGIPLLEKMDQNDQVKPK